MFLKRLKGSFPLIVVLGVLLFITTEGNAQVTQTHRFESKQRMNDETFSIIPLKEDGLVLLREKNDYKDGKQIWECILLDSALKERKNL